MLLSSRAPFFSRQGVDESSPVTVRRAPLVLDEIQYAPELVAAIKRRVDRIPKPAGKTPGKAGREAGRLAGQSTELRITKARRSTNHDPRANFTA